MKISTDIPIKEERVESETVQGFVTRIDGEYVVLQRRTKYATIIIEEPPMWRTVFFQDKPDPFYIATPWVYYRLHSITYDAIDHKGEVIPSHVAGHIDRIYFAAQQAEEPTSPLTNAAIPNIYDLGRPCYYLMDSGMYSNRDQLLQSHIETFWSQHFNYDGRLERQHWFEHFAKEHNISSTCFDRPAFLEAWEALSMEEVMAYEWPFDTTYTDLASYPL